MKWLVYVFLCIAAFGILVNKLGASLIALMFAGITIIAIRKFNEEDAAWSKDPSHAKHLHCSTSNALDDHECECTKNQI